MLWTTAFLLGVAAATTIDAPPIVFNSPRLVRMAAVAAAALVVIFEAVLSTKKPTHENATLLRYIGGKRTFDGDGDNFNGRRHWAERTDEDPWEISVEHISKLVTEAKLIKFKAVG